MSTQNRGFSGKRLFLFLGVGLLMGVAWYGGRVTAPVNSAHMGRMGGRMQVNDTTDPANQDFEGEEGAARCRAMMGVMEDMHRSMRSMMDGNTGETSRPSDSDSRMGRGMMHRGGGSMHGRMGRMGEEMNRAEMRRLCQTMQASMQDVMHGERSGDSAGSSGEVSDELDLETETEQWLGDTRGFDGVEDRTGESEVVIDVGAGTGLSYAPAAVRVDPGTTVRWRWTGNGGLHDVAFVNADVRSSLRGEQGETFTHTFAEPGEYRYECTPHAAVGMRGVVIVEGS